MARPGISTKNTEKIPPGPKFWNKKKIPEKLPKKYQNAHFSGILGYFLVFSGYFGAKFWESRISGRGVFFRYFSWKFRVGPFRGSVAGRGVLKNRGNSCTILRLTTHHIMKLFDRRALWHYQRAYQKILRELKCRLNVDNPRASYSRKPHKPQNRLKIPARHINSPYGRGSKKIPRKIPEKYPESKKKTRKSYFFEYSRGYLRGEFRGVSCFVCWGVFLHFVGFPLL